MIIEERFGAPEKKDPRPLVCCCKREFFIFMSFMLALCVYLWPQVQAWPHDPAEWQNAYCKMDDYRERCNYCSLAQNCVNDGFNFTNGCAFTLTMRFQ